MNADDKNNNSNSFNGCDDGDDNDHDDKVRWNELRLSMCFHAAQSEYDLIKSVYMYLLRTNLSKCDFNWSRSYYVPLRIYSFNIAAAKCGNLSTKAQQSLSQSFF